MFIQKLSWKHENHYSWFYSNYITLTVCPASGPSYKNKKGFPVLIIGNYKKTKLHSHWFLLVNIFLTKITEICSLLWRTLKNFWLYLHKVIHYATTVVAVSKWIIKLVKAINEVLKANAEPSFVYYCTGCSLSSI